MTTQINFLENFPTQEQVNSFINSANSTLTRIAENQTARMENYYNCIDDYSYGGICDRASDQHRAWLMNAKIKLQEQLEHGRPYVEFFSVGMLCDLSGNIVSDRIVNGRYGPCWIIKDGENVSFVGVATQQKTYNKKGFKVMRKVYEVEYYFLAKEGKNGLKCNSRVISEKMEDITGRVETSTHLNEIAWRALQN